MILVVCVALPLCSAATAATNQALAEITKPPALFISIDETLETQNIQVAGGIAVDIDDWKSIAISTAANETCAATLIAREAILTSGHCVDARPWADVASVAIGKVRFAGEEIDMKECEMHPAYRAAKQFFPFPRVPQDYALCTLTQPVDDTVDPEVVSDKPLTASTPILLMGFGCSGARYIDGEWKVVYDPEGVIVLRMGDASVSRTAAALDDGRPPQYALSVSDGTTPSICPRDSGGPVWTNVTAQAPDLPRRVSAVNSAYVPIRVGTPRIQSFLSPIDSEFRSWARHWGDRNGVEICGIHLPEGIGGCRE
jgi:hypothetical protein